ncbi:MAG: isocitrate/isopropylmalate family dehydrogenase [Gammaproteobacteria bacterium]|nr:isocitrate/isopropylmalate family dehydrogenase [Gammaproteobacteria bacterium]
MNKTIAVIEGDDAAPEAVRPVVALLDSLKLGLTWVYPEVGEAAEAARPSDAAGSTFPDSARAVIDAADTTLFGSTSGKSGAALGYLRWGKETYANVRPCRYLPGCASPLRHPEGIDFVIVRENLEDLYVGAEGPLADLAALNLVGRTIRKPLHELGDGRYAIKAITREGTERVVSFAFDLAAKRNGKRKLTCATKHNMLRATDGLFLDVTREVAADYPDIEFESFIVDDFACRMIREPERFDVVVMPNQYGDILSDAAGGLLGSLGLAASGCFGSDYAYFEPAHGTAPDIAGRNIINPTATILSTTMMLEYLGLETAAARIEDALARVYADGSALTPDQGGTTTTTEFCAALAQAL